MVVSEIMTEKPLCAEVTELIREAQSKLDALKIRHLPVVEDGTLVGIISDRDLAAFSREQGSMEQGTTVGDVMSANVVSVNVETEVAEAIDLLLEEKLGGLPVIDPDEGSVVGFLSYVDVLSTHADYFD